MFPCRRRGSCFLSVNLKKKSPGRYPFPNHGRDMHSRRQSSFITATDPLHTRLRVATDSTKHAEVDSCEPSLYYSVSLQLNETSRLQDGDIEPKEGS